MRGHATHIRTCLVDPLKRGAIGPCNFLSQAAFSVFDLLFRRSYIRLCRPPPHVVLVRLCSKHVVESSPASPRQRPCRGCTVLRPQGMPSPVIIGCLVRTSPPRLLGFHNIDRYVSRRARFSPSRHGHTCIAHIHHRRQISTPTTSPHVLPTPPPPR